MKPIDYKSVLLVGTEEHAEIVGILNTLRHPFVDDVLKTNKCATQDKEDVRGVDMVYIRFG